MLEKWGLIAAGAEFSYGPGDCVDEIYTEDLNGADPSIGWDTSLNYWECKIEGKTIIEDIEETPWNPIETTHEFLADSLIYDSDLLDDDYDILDSLNNFSELEDYYSDLDFYRLSELLLNDAFIELQNVGIRV